MFFDAVYLDEHLSSRWTEDVWTGLKHLAESDLRDFGDLRHAGRSLPADEHRAWEQALDEMTAEHQRLRARDYSVGNQYLGLIHFLNRRWFLLRGFMLVRRLDRSRGDHCDLWDVGGVGIGVVTDAASHRFQGGRFASYGVRNVFPSALRIPSGYFDPTLPGAVVCIDAVEKEVAQTLTLIHGGAAADRRELHFGKRPSIVHAWRAFATAISKRYRNAHALAQATCQRTWVEEMRHGVNSLRGGGRDEAGFADEPSFRAQQIAERMLLPGGRLWRSAFCPLPFGQVPQQHPDQERETLIDWGKKLADWMTPSHQSASPEDESDAEQIIYHERARAISELSAQLTAAAVGPDVMLVLLEWQRELQIISEECTTAGGGLASPLDDQLLSRLGTDTAHITAAAWGLILLSEYFGLPAPPPLRDPQQHDIVRAASLVTLLLQRRPEELRLAIQALYRREFKHAVDELPFARITAAGALQQPTLKS